MNKVDRSVGWIKSNQSYLYFVESQLSIKKNFSFHSSEPSNCEQSIINTEMSSEKIALEIP